MGVAAWAGWVGDTLAIPEVAWRLVALATLPTAVAFHWMNEWQPRVPASRAALIYLLEAVFASVFSVLMGHEKVTYPLVLGGLMILAGNAIGAFPPRVAVSPEAVPPPPPDVPRFP
jgi:drug/metabolite transporter (DMT)-like permease